jgi:hypothetical protein
MRLLLFCMLVLPVLPAQEVVLPDHPVVFGAAFEVLVEAKDAFDARRLLPLEVDLVESRRSGPGRMRFRYTARCYEVGDVVLAVDPPRILPVVSSLPTPGGDMEWPSDGWLMKPASQSMVWALGGGICGSLLLLAWWLLRKKGQANSSECSTSLPTWDAMADLKALPLPQGPEQSEAFYLRLKAIVRRYCEDRFGILAKVRTSEELAEALPNLQDSLHPCLDSCDAALFGQIRMEAVTHVDARDKACELVDATSRRGSR